MFLTEKRRHLSLSLSLSLPPFTNPNPNPSSRSFDLDLALRLRSLLPVPSPLTLSWVARAADLLASTLADAAPLLSRSSDPDPDALASHLRSGLSLLDAANSASAALDLLLRRRLLLRLALRLLPSSAPNSRRALADWDRPQAPPITIAGPEPPCAASAARRAIYATEAVAALVLRSVAAALGCGGADESPPLLPRVPAELPWATEFNELAVEIPLKLAGEVEAVADAVKRLTAVIDGHDDPAMIRRAAEEVDKLTEQMTEGLYRLSNAVNALFRAAMLTRNAALDTFRIGPQKCR